MTSEIVQWFKTSIPGIIILGALGSILALVLLKVIKRAVPHLSGFLLSRFLFPFFKFVMAEELVAVRLMKAGDQTKLLIHCVLDNLNVINVDCAPAHIFRRNDNLFCG